MNLRKLIKSLPTGFAQEADALSPEALKAAIIVCETNIAESERAKENDEQLHALREKLQELNGSYADAVKTQRAKIRYMLLLLEQKGLLLHEGDDE